MKENVLKEFYAVERLIQDIFGDELVKTRWRGKPDFYSLFVTIYDMSKDKRCALCGEVVEMGKLPT